MQAIDKDTEQLVKRIQAAVRAAKLRRLSLEEGWRRRYQRYIQMGEQEAAIER
jgi:acetyl-CoA carboxylase alpha subunit